MPASMRASSNRSSTSVDSARTCSCRAGRYSSGSASPSSIASSIACIEASGVRRSWLAHATSSRRASNSSIDRGLVEALSVRFECFVEQRPVALEHGVVVEAANDLGTAVCIEVVDERCVDLLNRPVVQLAREKTNCPDTHRR